MPASVANSNCFHTVSRPVLSKEYLQLALKLPLTVLHATVYTRRNQLHAELPTFDLRRDGAHICFFSALADNSVPVLWKQ